MDSVMSGDGGWSKKLRLRKYSGRIILYTCAVVLTVTAMATFLVVVFGKSENHTIAHGHYNVDKSQISVSGISSGSAMATQMHVIFSKTFMGAGLIAGPPFACSGHNGLTAVTACMSTPGLISPSALIAITESGDKLGNIDHVTNMANDKVYIFDGKVDSVVNPSIGIKTADFYRHFLSDDNNIKTEFNINAQHGQPTENYGGRCDQLSTDNYMLNCNYSAAYELLNFIYDGHLKKPTKDYVARGKIYKWIYSRTSMTRTPLASRSVVYKSSTGTENSFESTKVFDPSEFESPKFDCTILLIPSLYRPLKLMKFSQSDFFYLSPPSVYSMDTVGYVYIPTACASKTKQCKLHVAFHGCQMGEKRIGDVYVRHAGYNEVGELNDVIILYPQVITTVTNPQGCWDWFGYTGQFFATKLGFQPTALKRMIDKITG